jgi:hypothetical protein
MPQMPLPPMDPSMGMGMPPLAAPAGPANFNPADLVAAPPAAPKKKSSGKSKSKGKKGGKY